MRKPRPYKTFRIVEVRLPDPPSASRLDPLGAVNQAVKTKVFITTASGPYLEHYFSIVINIYPLRFSSPYTLSIFPQSHDSTLFYAQFHP